MEKIKKVDSDFKKLYNEIADHKFIKIKNPKITNLTMTTYVICKCGKKFRSEIQTDDLITNIIPDDNPQKCPHCGERILTGKGNMINE